jgi:hypothetical protein
MGGMVLCVIALAIWLPRGRGLDRFATPDEYFWLTRSANFLTGLAQRDFASTYQVEHPGVTVMWVGAMGLLAKYPAYLSSGQGQVNPDQFDAFFRRRNRPSLLELLRTERAILVVVQTLVLVIAFLYARRLIGILPAVLGFFLIAFDPYHLALTRLLHLDGLMSNLMLLSILAFSGYRLERRVRDLIVSAIAAGLSWLTKSPAILLVPAIGLLVLRDFREGWLLHPQASKLRRMWLVSWPGLAWLSVGICVFVVLWPAMWVHPIQVLVQMTSRVQQYVEEGHGSALFFNGQIAEDGKLGLSYFYFYPLTYLWRVTPATLAGLLLAALFAKRPPLNQRWTRTVIWGLLLVVGIFFIGITPSAKKLERYVLPAFAPFDLIAGLGWVGLAGYIKEKSGVMKRYTGYLIIAAAMGLQILFSLPTYPYYLPYYNPLLGGSRKAPQVLQIGWGEGLDQAAAYLNRKPDVRNLRVISWYAAGPFSYFFKGRSRSLWYESEYSKDDWDTFLTSDYAVIYINEWQRNLPAPVLDYVSNLEPEHSIWINGLEYVRIYKIP